MEEKKLLMRPLNKKGEQSHKKKKQPNRFIVLCKKVIQPRANKFWKQRSPRLSSVPPYPDLLFYLLGTFYFRDYSFTPGLVACQSPGKYYKLQGPSKIMVLLTGYSSFLISVRFSSYEGDYNAVAERYDIWRNKWDSLPAPRNVDFSVKGCASQSKKVFVFTLQRATTNSVKVECIELEGKSQWSLLQTIQVPKIYWPDAAYVGGHILLFGNDNSSEQTTFQITEEGRKIKQSRQKFDGFRTRNQRVWHQGKNKLEVYLVGSSFSNSQVLKFQKNKWQIV